MEGKKGTTNTPQESGRSSLRRFVGKVDWGYRIAGNGFDFIGEGLIFLGRGSGHAFQFNFCRVVAGKAFTSISVCQRSSSERRMDSLLERDVEASKVNSEKSRGVRVSVRIRREIVELLINDATTRAVQSLRFYFFIETLKRLYILVRVLPLEARNFSSVSARPS